MENLFPLQKKHISLIQKPGMYYSHNKLFAILKKATLHLVSQFNIAVIDLE
jgi:hypothetical protein